MAVHVQPGFYFYGNTIVASKDNRYLYTIGNKNVPASDMTAIIKITCNGNIENCVWTKIPTKLQNDVKDTVAMPIPNALADKLCN